jgi:hypothetical protein
MWLFTTFGFFSIVEKKGDRRPGTLTVRARVRRDLTALRRKYLPELGRTIEKHTSDYRFRAQVPREALAAAMPRIVQDLHYENFKDTVKKRQGENRADLYEIVWLLLESLQPRVSTRRRKPTRQLRRR